MKTISPIKKQGELTRRYYWEIFRLIFVFFSFYLLGDVLYRWNGVKFHSTFFEFLPSIALASILWSIIAVCTAFFIWLPLKIVLQCSKHLQLTIKLEHLELFSGFWVLLAAVAWLSKYLIFSDLLISFQLKLLMIILISCVAIPLTWQFRNTAEQWIIIVQDRITIWVWSFGFFVLISVLLVSFHLWKNDSSTELLQQPTKSAISESDKKRPNILLVTFDALTARNMSVYGYQRETTPFIKKWAKSASLFTKTEAEGSFSASNNASLVTGKRTWTHRKYHHDPAAKPLKSETENLALVLKENGYYNSAFIASEVIPVNSLGIASSIDTAPSLFEFYSPKSIEGLIDKYLFLLFGSKFNRYNWLGQEDFIFTVLLRKIDKKVFTTEYPPQLAFNKFLEMMNSNPHEPFFAWIHVWPPHSPYAPPKPFAGTFNSSWKLREKNKMYSYNPEINKYSSNNLPFPKELNDNIKILRDYYDEFILYSDNQFQNFIAELQRKDWLKNTVIILSSDHGESFEHNYFQHGPTHLYEQVTHIPLIIKEPGQTGPRIIDDLVEQVDIPVTILDLADIPIPSWMEGRSLLPLLRDKELPPKTAIAASLIKNIPTEPITKGIIAVWEGDYKLIHYLENEKSLLFNLKKDPKELSNIFNDEPDTGQRLLSFIKHNLEETNNKIIAEKQNSLNNF